MLSLFLSHKNFRWFFISDFVSSFGSWLSFIGLNWFVIQQTGSSTDVGTLMSIHIAAGLLASPLVGVMTDRFHRKSIIVWSNMIRGLVTGGVALYLLAGTFHMSVLYCLGALNGAGWTFYFATSKALLQECLAPEELAPGNSLMEISLQVGMFIAAGLSGILYEQFGIVTILVIDAITFFVSNATLAGMKHLPENEGVNRESFLTMMYQGYRYVFEHPNYLGIGLLTYLPLVLGMTLNVLLPAYVGQALRQNAVVFGLVDMTYGIGACLAGFLVLTLLIRFPLKKVIPIFYFLSFGLLLSFGFIHWLTLVYAAMFFLGISNTAIRILLSTHLMRLVPKRFMGRISALLITLTRFSQSVVAYGVGRIMDRLAVQYGFFVLAAIMSLGIVGALLGSGTFMLPHGSKRTPSEGGARIFAKGPE